MTLLAIASFLAQLFLGWLLADFLSGVLHWIEDRFGPGREDWPVLGPLIFTPNLIHHDVPTLFLDSGFVERNWTTWAVVVPLAAALLLLFGSHPLIWAAAVGGAMANEIHAWAHRRTMLPVWARTLQDWGVIQSPGHHAVHHIPDHRRNFCIVTNWLNPILDHYEFWYRIERRLPKGWIA